MFSRLARGVEHVKGVMFMRKIIVTQFMTLDGVVQALGTPDEAKYDDTSGVPTFLPS